MPATSLATAAASAASGSPAVSLDLHGESSHAAERPLRCERWPKRLALLSAAGLVAGRCNSPNKCAYCARLAAVETSEMLALDAMKGYAPRVWLVLTTRETAVLMRQSPEAMREQQRRFYKAREKLMRAIKRRWPGAEYVCVVEFTSGYAARSGGHRRPHWNVLIKGVGPECLVELEALVRERWCASMDAEPDAQFAGAIAEVGGLMKYLALHFLKESQQPPEGWRGQRVTASRGYFGPRSARGSVTARARCRVEAREALRLKRELWRAEQEGHEGEAAELVAASRIERAKSLVWECVVKRATETGELKVHRLDGSESIVRRSRARERERVAAVVDWASWRARERVWSSGYVEQPRAVQLVIALSRRRD